MQYHLGRLIDHVHLRVSDLEASRRFYRAILNALDLSDAIESPAAVRKFHAALAAGRRDNGAAGKRSHGASYYAAFALDPDGNNIEAVYHGPVKKSAPSVVVQPSSGQ